MRKHVIAIVFLFGGCGTNISPDEIVGTYWGDHGIGSDELVISIDGTYAQNFKINGKAFTRKGVWRVTSRQDHQLEFEDFLFHPELKKFENLMYGRSESFGGVGIDEPSVWAVSPTRRLFGTVRLCFGAENEYCYLKKP